MSQKPQLHKRIVLLYLKEVLEAYDKKRVALSEAMDMLGLSRPAFFRYLKFYRENPRSMGVIQLRRGRKKKLLMGDEEAIDKILLLERKIVDRYKHVKRFNFKALSGELKRHNGIAVSSETLRQRAISMGIHTVKKRGAKIFRELVTSKIGRLFQHDTCIHEWSPFMNPFYLILTVDDHSRRIVCARFFAQESSMNHILCVRDVVQLYGIPLAYYTDQHSIFTYIPRSSYRANYQTAAEDAQVQWKRVMELLQIQHILAKSPQAKGKVESKFKYLQGRIVRRCAKEEVTSLEHAQKILDQEIEYYNDHKKHETTQQTPRERWEKAETEGRSLLRVFELNEGESWKDYFCLEYNKKLNKYGKTKVEGIEIQLKKSPSQQVVIHYIAENTTTEIRVLVDGTVLKTLII